MSSQLQTRDGGLSPEKPADEKVQEMCNKVRSVLAKYGDSMPANKNL